MEEIVKKEKKVNKTKKKKEEKQWTVKILNPQPVEEVNRRLTIAAISLAKQGLLTIPGYEMYFPKSN